VVLLIGATGGLYLWSEARVRQTAATFEARQVEAQRLADSTRQAAQAEYNRLRVALDSARSSSAPAAVVDSLRNALSEASSRTQALEASLQRAQASLNLQLAAGDSLRRQAQAELQRLRGELSRATGSQVSSALLDSLRRAVQDAEARATSIEGQLRAVKGVDMPALSQANQGSVGLVTGFSGSDDAWNGSGFVITRSGYFVTNRHVAMAEEQQSDSVVFRPADSLFVTLADHPWQDRARATVVSVYPAGGPDLALLKIADYSGSYIPKVDWDGAHARQGDAAALIGFPQGEGLAYDRETRTFRTSMAAGNCSGSGSSVHAKLPPAKMKN
jgi:hypothetical protein